MNDPKRDLQSEFLKALAELGVAPAKAEDFTTDGRIHRYRVEGDRSGSLNGWFVFYDVGGLSAGAFGSWKIKIKMIIRFKKLSMMSS